MPPLAGPLGVAALCGLALTSAACESREDRKERRAAEREAWLARQDAGAAHAPGPTTPAAGRTGAVDAGAAPAAPAAGPGLLHVEWDDEAARVILDWAASGEGEVPAGWADTEAQRLTREWAKWSTQPDPDPGTEARLRKVAEGRALGRPAPEVARAKDLLAALERRRAAFVPAADAHLAGFLPEGTEIGSTVRTTLFVPPWAFAWGDGTIVVDVADPYWKGEVGRVENLLVHELFHLGLTQHVQGPGPAAAGSHLELARSLRWQTLNEGAATLVASRAPGAPDLEDYRWLADRVEVARRFALLRGLLADVDQAAAPLDVLKTRSFDVGNQQRAYYVVGATVAAGVERDRGREGLLAAWTAGPDALLAAWAETDPPPDLVLGRGPDGPACPESRVLSHRVKARLWPKERKLKGTAVLEVSCAPVEGLLLFLNRELTLTAARVDGSPVRIASAPAGELMPYVPVAKGVFVDTGPRAEAIHVEVEWEGPLVGTYGEVNELAEARSELAVYAAWYPMIRGGGPFAEDVEVEVPPFAKVIGRGEDLKETRGEVMAHHFRSPVKATDHVVLIAPEQELSLEAEHQGVAVSVHFSKLPGGTAHAAGEAAAKSLAWLRGHFGKVPGSAEATLVYARRAGWGYSRPGLIVVSEERARGRTGDDDVRDDVHGNAHELAHFWWGAGEPTSRNDWMNEALAEYSALRVSEALYGAGERERWIARYRAHVVAEAPPTCVLDTRSDSPHRYVSWYERGALFFDALEREVSTKKLDAFLKAIANAQTLSTLELERRLLKAFGPKVQPLFDAWLRRVELPGEKTLQAPAR